MQPTEVDYLSVRTVTELATVPTAGFPNGTTCVVAGSSFVLVDAQGAADGTTIIAAFGDPTGRQWITASLLNPALSGVVITVPNATALAARSAAGLPDGTWAFVQTYKTYFCLIASTQAASANVRIAALGNAGHVWERGYVSEPAWWSTLSWVVDPQNVSGLASDENTGVDATHPLLTCAEQSRRFRGRNLPGTETNSWALTLMSDAADTDYFQVHIGANYRNAAINCSVVGTVSVVAVGTITAATAKNAATNVGNTITVPGFDFSTQIGRILRLVGTPTTNAVIETAPSLGVARLSEIVVAGAAPSGSAGFTAGQVVEIQVSTKLPGITVEGVGIQLFATDCTFNPAGAVFITAPATTNVVLTRCELRGGGGGSMVGLGINLVGCSIVGRAYNVTGVLNTTGGSVINGSVTLTSAYLRHHPDSWGLQNAAVILADHAVLRLHADFHCFGLGAGAVGVTEGYGSIVYSGANYYGSGNSATSWALSQPGGAMWFYPLGFPPNMDAGLGALQDGANVALAALPSPSASGGFGRLTPSLNAIVGQ